MHQRPVVAKKGDDDLPKGDDHATALLINDRLASPALCVQISHVGETVSGFGGMAIRLRRGRIAEGDGDGRRGGRFRLVGGLGRERGDSDGGVDGSHRGDCQALMRGWSMRLFRGFFDGSREISCWRRRRLRIKYKLYPFRRLRVEFA